MDDSSGDDGADGFALECPAVIGAVSAFAVEGFDVDGPGAVRVDEGDVGVGSEGQMALVDAEDAGGVDGHFGDEGGPVEDGGFDEGFDVEAEGGFDADESEGGVEEFEFFFLSAVRGVVGGEAVDGSVGEAAFEGFDIAGGSEGRGDLAVGIEVFAGLVGEDEVVRCGFGGDGDGVSAFGFADEFDGFGGGEVGDVEAASGGFGEFQVAVDHDLFGDSGAAGHAEYGGDVSAVDASAGEGGVFAVFDEDLVEHGDVLHGAEGDAGVGDSVAVVAEGDGPGSDHAAHFGEFLAFEALGDGADGEDVGVTELGVLSEDEVDGGFAVEGRVGVGHAGDAGESAGGGGAGAAGDGFLFLVSGFAEVDVHVDEAGGDEQAVGVDDGVGAGAIGPEVGDLAVFEEEVGLFVELVGRVDHPAAGDEGSAVRHVSSSAYKDRGATGFMDRADHCTGRRCESKRRGRGNRRCPLDELAKRDSISGEELARRSGGPDGCDEGGQDGTRPEP